MNKLKGAWHAFKQIRYDVFHIERKLIRTKYHFSLSPSKNRYILKCDGYMNHGGFFDRMKGAVSIFALSKVHGKDFKLSFTHPFDLRNYLEPNRYDWTIDESQIDYNYPATKPIIGYFEFMYPWRIILKRLGEVHYYFGYNILDRINKKYGTSFDWKELYDELFKPSYRLQQLINLYQIETTRGGYDNKMPYYAIHIRFLNLLGDDNESNPAYKKLDKESADELMECCIKKIEELRQCNGNSKRYLLSTDSNVFMEKAKTRLSYIYSIPGQIRHIDNVADDNDDGNIKLFLDYYMLSEAEEIYSFIGSGLYKSDFPNYAAIIGGKVLKRINI